MPRLAAIMTTIANNLQTVQQRLLHACAQAGRAPGSVQLLAVSKTFGVDAVAQLPGLVLRGVMSIPEWTVEFAAQKELHLRAKTVFEQILAAGGAGLQHFDTLSLGMTADLEAAVAAGSTLVRVGSGIFGARAPAPG